MEKISSVRDLINLWPRRADLASECQAHAPGQSVTVARVHKWAENDAIPAKYHLAVLAAAQARAFPVTADLIVRLHAPASRSAA